MKDIRRVAQEAEWSELLARVEHPQLTQMWAYGEGKAAIGWHPQRLVIERQGDPVAICQVLVKRGLISRINRGPLLLRSDEPDVEGIYHTLRRRWCYFMRGPLAIAPALIDGPEQVRLLQAAGFRRWSPKLKKFLPFTSNSGLVRWCSAYLDLRLSEAELRKNLVQTWRNQLNSSERKLTLRISTAPEDIEWMIARHVSRFQDQDIKFFGPERPLVAALAHAAKENFIIVQGCLDGTPVGAAAIVRYGLTAEYYLGWYSPEGRKANVGNFVVWHSAAEMRRRGSRYFDLGSYHRGQGGYHKFKQGMNGIEYQMTGEWFSLW